MSDNDKPQIVIGRDQFALLILVVGILMFAAGVWAGYQQHKLKMEVEHGSRDSQYEGLRKLRMVKLSEVGGLRRI